MPPTSETPVCPTCSGRGIARTVMSKFGIRTVTYECDTCNHRWELKDVEAPIAWLQDAPNYSEAP
jgi:DnaJ-class molecular chaperone